MSPPPRLALVAALALACASSSSPPRPAGPIPCSATSPCPQGMTCGYAPGCDAREGVCQDTTCGALPVMRPTCGCDGQTTWGGACRPTAPYRAVGACEPAASP